MEYNCPCEVVKVNFDQAEWQLLISAYFYSNGQEIK